MSINHDELQKINELQQRIEGARLAAKDVREDGVCKVPLVEQPDRKEYREYRAMVGQSGYAELERLVTDELIPQIRELVTDYPNPFNKDKEASS